MCAPPRAPVLGLIGALLLAGALPAAAQTTYFVRPDGGDASRCLGTTDAPDPGVGTGQDCAWNHPFQALPPFGSLRISGGDTLIVAAGDYAMGIGAPGAESCDDGASWDCHLPPLPSGAVGQPTRLLGEGWDAGCPSPPELWGTGRPWQILDLTGSDHVEVACLEITDRSDCIEFHNQAGLPCDDCDVTCERVTPPFGPWASVGIHAEDSSSVVLRDLDVHGLASVGIRAGRLTDWTVERVRIRANGVAGWDGDLLGDSSNAGDLVFREVEIAWNGCAEDPETGAILTGTCWGQEAGGYGDGMGLADSEGRWILEDVDVHHNTSDGLDLLYLVGSSRVEGTRVRSWSNAGNAFKVAGDVALENSLLVADCSSFESSPLMTSGDLCRAGGNTLALSLFAGSEAEITNVTITGEGDCLLEVECRDASCDGSETALLRNVLFAGGPDWAQPGDRTCLYWWEDSVLPTDPVTLDHSLVFDVENDVCPGTASVCGQDPGLLDRGLATFDGHLQQDSPAVDAGTAVDAPADDLDGVERSGAPDIGAYELVTRLFADGFESGTTAAWTPAAP